LLDARLVLAQKASAGAYGDGGAAAGAGTEVSLAESVSLLTSFARHPAAAPPVVNSLSELLAAAPSATFAAAPPLLARLSSLLPALYSAHSGPAVDSLLKVFAAALAQMPPPGAPGGGALATDLLARIANDVARVPSSEYRATIFARLSMQVRGRAPNLFSRLQARMVLQAFASVDMEQDPVFQHLSRIARGRAALPTERPNQMSQEPGATSAADDLLQGKRGLF